MWVKLLVKTDAFKNGHKLTDSGIVSEADNDPASVGKLLCVVLPETVQIAILVCGDDSFTLRQRKLCDGLFIGAEILFLIPKIRLQNDPHDVMGFRVSPEELKRIEEAADSAYMTPSAYARACALRQKIQVVPGLEDAVHQLKKIGANLNQLTILAHEGQITAVKLDETNEALQSLFYPLIKIMERKPKDHGLDR